MSSMDDIGSVAHAPIVTNMLLLTLRNAPLPNQFIARRFFHPLAVVCVGLLRLCWMC